MDFRACDVSASERKGRFMTVSQQASRVVALPASLQVRRVGETLGGEVSGVDLSKPITDAERQGIMDALHAHKVIVLRDQHLDKEQMVAVTRRLGPIGENILPGEADGGRNEVAVASNAGADGKPNGQHTDFSSLRWHTDRSFMPRPAAATLFYGVTVPSSGGDTLFADTVAAYEALPAAMKARIDEQWALHWVGYSRDARNGGLGAVGADVLQQAPPVRHPLVRPHDVTGEKAIYCGCHAWKVEGMDEASGRALLDGLVAHASQDQFVYRHQWRNNDLVIWDNRSTLHAGTAFAGDKELRLMYRTIVEAEAAD
ncbi:MAG: taurine dioxygenase [Gammaproteobacteria bacterium]